jgi:nucleotide-binding universal stress UspA family protein
MDQNIRRKILLAVDGSDQALEAVRYAGNMLPGDRTEIVLFNVGTGFPEVFWDLKRNPLYESKKSEVMEWLAEYQLGIGEFNEKALHILIASGFEADAVSVKTQTRKIGVLKDIIQESYQGYNAIIVGRSGMSRLKDLILRSMAYKLAEKVKHIPVVIVGGKPVGRKILIALDESIEAMRGVSCIGALAGTQNPEITIVHCLHPSVKGSQDSQDRLQYSENRFKPYMDEATQRLIETGVRADNISGHFMSIKSSAIHSIMEMALTEEFATIVVGHRQREAVGFAQAYFQGRFSEQLIKMLNNMAVWVIN